MPGLPVTDAQPRGLPLESVRGFQRGTHHGLALRLPPTVTAVAMVQAAIKDEWFGVLDGLTLGDLIVVASELVSNSVLHAALREEAEIGARFTRLDRSAIRIEVRDEGRGFQASLRDPIPRSGGGRGLKIVRGLSRRWGVFREHGCTTVWAELGP